MLTIHDLLEDPQYKEFFLQVPKIPDVAKHPSMTPPWVLYVKLKTDRKWHKKRFWKYTDAFKRFKQLLKDNRVEDAAIHCSRFTFAPPIKLVRIKGKFIKGSDGKLRQATRYVVWKPKLPFDEIEEHLWCPYCRRPTVFKYYAKHAALAHLGYAIDPTVRRCAICGSSTRIIDYKRPL